jgi:hypothetical protein
VLYILPTKYLIRFDSRKQIGEISLMKDMTSAATTMLSEDTDSVTLDSFVSTPAVSTGSDLPSLRTSLNENHPPPLQSPLPSNSGSSGSAVPPDVHDHSNRSSLVFHNNEKDTTSNKGNMKEKETGKKRAKLTPEQRKKLEELDKERRKAMEVRIAMLTTKLAERLRPYVEAKHPGDKDDPETLAFEAKIRREADDLKLESFGVEVCTCRSLFQ